MQELRELPRSEKITNLAAQTGTGALEAGGLALYGYTVAETFSNDASVLDEAAALTSILPIIGCSVQAVNDAQRGDLTAAYTALCFTEDILYLSELWEVALGLQVVETVLETIQEFNEPDRLYNRELFLERRLKGWSRKIKEVENLIGSGAFTQNITDGFSSYQIGVLSQASQLVGDLHAAYTHQLDLEQSHSANATSTTFSPNRGSNPKDEASLNFALQQEIERQICVESARNKLRVQKALET